ncbi:MAG: anti-sigma-D factor RsdA [Gordonia sp. (in: high G+C Gram-positive bacteria)]|uniref:anti-sigma-D factor RsdA n=1 Tax=Gordonia sp. (in: high G+C Gram-positive bacteria) TaxID=84139 RepID=UPI0039E225CD
MTDQDYRGEAADVVSVDLNAVRHDDRFLDALLAGHALPDSDRSERELGELLFAWRAESLADPVPEQPTLADVEKALAAQKADEKRKSTSRHLRLVSGAAAITAVAAAGLLVLSENSQPGDPLWNVKKVVFAEEAEQTQATVDVQSNLEQAEAALASGDQAKAAALVARAERDLGPVQDRATRERMQQWIKRLRNDDGAPAVSSTRTATKAPSSDAATLPSSITDPTTPSNTVSATVTQSRPSTPTPTPQPTEQPTSPPQQQPSTTTPTATSEPTSTSSARTSAEAASDPVDPAPTS